MTPNLLEDPAFWALNPRLRAFAHSRGTTGEDLAGRFAPHDFMGFIRRELRAFCDTLGRKEARLGSEADHQAFTGYLLAKYPAPGGAA